MRYKRARTFRERRRRALIGAALGLPSAAVGLIIVAVLDSWMHLSDGLVVGVLVAVPVIVGLIGEYRLGVTSGENDEPRMD